jgi:energy-converting hydrogenase Eha subunit F
MPASTIHYKYSTPLRTTTESDDGVGKSIQLSPGDLIDRVIYISAGLRAGLRASQFKQEIPFEIEIPLERMIYCLNKSK